MREWEPWARLRAATSPVSGNEEHCVCVCVGGGEGSWTMVRLRHWKAFQLGLRTQYKQGMNKYDDMDQFHDNAGGTINRFHNNAGRTINRFHDCSHGYGRERDDEGEGI